MRNGKPIKKKNHHAYWFTYKLEL